MPETRSGAWAPLESEKGHLPKNPKIKPIFHYIYPFRSFECAIKTKFMKLFSVFAKYVMFACVVSFFFSCSNKRSGKAKVLVFSKTAGFHHESIADGNVALLKLGADHGFEVDTTTDARMFHDDTLQKYSAVVFLNPTGDVLNHFEEAAFERYIQAGGGYVGIHAAADCEYDWGWYGRLVGGYFLSHPGVNDTFPNVQEGVLHVVDNNHPATKELPEEWKKRDEFYNFKKRNPGVQVLLTIDEKTYNGGENGDNHPMAWYHEYDGGRAFYTALGHTSESYTDPLFLKHILGGIEYAIGDNHELDFEKATTQIPPEDNRFTKTPLIEGQLFEPTEMTILPNFDILVAQRRGEIMFYKNGADSLKQVGFLDVYHKTLHTPGVNAEEGVMGLAKDPNFEKNHWIYVYYSPADTSVNRLSRFTFEKDTLHPSTEKIILEIGSKREICCHTGGSIAFGPDGLLYLSTGDNSTPFNEKDVAYVNSGFAPLNDIPGHEQYDAARTAGNTNDLRGKILRIKINDDATYAIPDGNLFPEGTEKTRPEIYVMGNRNPYRISIDQKNSYLYWGEVGPDANNDSLETRGPRGYDEINQARKAGFYGWPFFVGDNYAYRRYNYATGESGDTYEPQRPLNDSRNNTGLRELPPAQPAFIWYPYAESPHFPQVGTGGRNAMAGPVYYTDMFPAETRLPEYYNGKLIIYDWIRGWMKAVTLQENGDFDKMEPFFGSAKLNNPIDMEVGPDGRLYLLEYGSGWFSKNPDAGLFRIDYNAGNRPPVVESLAVDKYSGLLPFTVTLRAVVSDPEKDELTYEWNFGDGTQTKTSVPEAQHTFKKAGDYALSVKAVDNNGAISNSSTVNVYAGNVTPVVHIDVQNANSTFFVPGKPVQYSVKVEGKDKNSFDPENLFVSVDYSQQMQQVAAMGHQENAAAGISGRNIMMSLDCQSCHKVEEKSVGPSFRQISKRYGKDPKAVDYLANKILNGSVGVWGEVAMAAHSSLPIEDAKQIVSWILSLENANTRNKSLPASGKVVPPKTPTDNKTRPPQAMVLTATYTNTGGANIKALSGTASIVLRNNTVLFSGNERTRGFSPYKHKNVNVMIFPTGGGWLAIDSISLTGVDALKIYTNWQKLPEIMGFEIRLDAPDGKLLGSGAMPRLPKDQTSGSLEISLQPVTDGKLHSLYIVSEPKEGITGAISSVEFMLE